MTGEGAGAEGSGVPRVGWLAPSENPWPVPVLDLRPVATTMMSTSQDPAAAANAISFGGDDGSAFMDASPPAPRRVGCELRYRVDQVLADGVLFTPSAMEHKWAVFFRRQRLLFVRSWQRRLLVAAETTFDARGLIVTSVDGAIVDPDEPPEFTIASVDFLIRSHALDLAHPAPLVADPSPDLQQAALWAFSLYGNRALYASHVAFAAPMPEQPLRTNSLFHIAIAQGDLTAAQAQLDRGVPIDLLARDGLNALQWALATPSTGVLEWLVQRGCPVDSRSDEGATALMNTVQGNDVARTRWLLDHGADVNARDARGFTCLHRAAEMGNHDFVRLLLDRGADRRLEAEGHTAASLARGRGHTAIVALLE